MLSGRNAPEPDSDIYVAMNMHWEALPIRPPNPAEGARWRVAINTSMPSPDDIFEPGEEPLVHDTTVIAASRSIIVLIADNRSFEGEK
jgi:glycogen operon protein